MPMIIEIERSVNTITDFGHRLLASGAEIHRVEDTVERLALAAGFTAAEVYATPTGLFATLVSSAGPVYSRVRRIRRVEPNLARIAALNQLSREFSAEPDISVLEASLMQLSEKAGYGPFWTAAAGGLGSAAFAVIFAGSWKEMLLGAGIGFAAMLWMLWARQRQIPAFLACAAAAAAAAVLGTLGAHVLTASSDIAILAGVMVLVPGVAMTSSLRDLLSGELVSGVARAAEAATTAVAVAVGVAAVLGILGVLPW